MQKGIKRQRSQNWLDEDKVILKNLIKERIQIIANKNTDSNTNKKKEKAWDELLSRFNKVCTGVTRTLPQVKAQWCFMKMHAKKVKAEKREELIKAGGSLPPSSHIQSNEIPVWLPIEVKIETDDSDTVTMVSTPDVPGPSTMTIGVDEVKSEKLASPVELITENPVCPILGSTSNNQHPVMCSDSNDQWLCSDSNDNGINSDLVKTNNEGVKRKIKNKKTIGSLSAQSPAAQVAAVETACRRELHRMQMKLASLQVANEEHKSNLLHLEEEVHYTKIEYYKRKIQYYSGQNKQ